MRTLTFLLVSLLTSLTFAADTDKDGFTPLFNGKDLSGWTNVNCHPSTFFVRDEMIITTGTPTGFLRTAKQYENFILEMEWFHVNEKESGNSGLFVWGDPLPALGTPYTRGIEVQVLVNLEKENAYTSDGDVFSIHGATCKPDRPHPMGWQRCLPSERRSKGGGHWNHYRVEAKDGAIKLHVNGKEVSGVSECSPRKGYLALESEGAECRFRNIKIKELPSTNPSPEQTATQAQGEVSLFSGLDLAGWKADVAHEGHWKAGGGVLRCDGKSPDAGKQLPTKESYRDCAVRCDWKTAGSFNLTLRNDGKTSAVVTIDPSGEVRIEEGQDTKTLRGSAKIAGYKPGQWQRVTVSARGNSLSVSAGGKIVVEAELGSALQAGSLGLADSGAAAEYMNLFVRDIK